MKIDAEFKLEFRKQILNSKKNGMLSMESIRLLRQLANYLANNKLFFFSSEDDKQDVITNALIDCIKGFEMYNPEKDRSDESCFMFFKTVMWRGMTKMHKYISEFKHEKA
jgi:transcriptional regulator with XRE-family HTH domain